VSVFSLSISAFCLAVITAIPCVELDRNELLSWLSSIRLLKLQWKQLILRYSNLIIFFISLIFIHIKSIMFFILLFLALSAMLRGSPFAAYLVKCLIVLCGV